MSSPAAAVAEAPPLRKVEKGDTLLEVRNLKKYFPVTEGILIHKTVGNVKAVDGVSFEIKKGETLGLVGESGCGKTTTGRCILQLDRPTEGEIVFEGVNLEQLDDKALSPLRQKVQVIFQDPYSSLNPRFTVERLVGEALVVHNRSSRAGLKKQVEDLLGKVGLSAKYMKRYPHEFSGGQRQRIGLARALALRPDYLVCDEPVSALDVSIQAQIINLLKKLQQENNISMLFISHDLAVVKHLSHKTAVMYLGEVVEIGPTEIIHKEPAHPYTRALLASQPSLDPKKKGQRVVLGGDVPSPLTPPSGCHFHPRCPDAMERCRVEAPQPVNLGKGHKVHCHLFESPAENQTQQPTE